MERRIKRLFGKACTDYHLLEDGDNILVALSGGKDSLELVRLLGRQAKIHKPSIRVEAAHVVMDNIPYQSNIQALDEFCQNEGVKLHIIHTSFDPTTDKRKTPCFLCAWNRRKALFRFAEENAFNKIALGHHMDDFIVTMLLNLSYESTFSTMKPLLRMDHYNVEIIRPLCLVHEEMIRTVAKTDSFPHQERTCPYEQQTKRNMMEQLFHNLEADNPEVRYSMWQAICKA